MAGRLQRLVRKEFAERRMVTVLFSDVGGCTATAEKPDPEGVMEIIVAFFGAPIAQSRRPCCI